MANFPDIDTLVIRLLKLEHHKHHRTWSHSFLGSIFFVPFLAFILKLTLGGPIGWAHALFIAWACFYSHLLTDWITAYGISVFWTPTHQGELYSLGVITIFDSVTLIIWYTTFIASWYGILPPTVLLMIFSITLFAWLSYKRVLLSVAFHYSLTLSKGPLRYSWLQPSSFRPHLFGYFYGLEEVKLREEIRPLALRSFGRFAPWPADKSFIQAVKDAYTDRELGYHRVAPRDSLINGNKPGGVFKMWMRKNTINSLVIVLLHALWFIYALRSSTVPLSM